jgi:hypothetical protein
VKTAAENILWTRVAEQLERQRLVLARWGADGNELGIGTVRAGGGPAHCADRLLAEGGETAGSTDSGAAPIQSATGDGTARRAEQLHKSHGAVGLLSSDPATRKTKNVEAVGVGRILSLFGRTFAWLCAVVFLLGVGVGITTGQQPAEISAVTSPPSPVGAIAATVMGERGNGTIYYFVVARYPGGYTAQTVPGRAIAAPGVSQLSVSRFVRVSWASVTGATSYDVLRSTSPLFPATAGSCVSCAVTLGTTAATVDDTGSALSNWPAAGTQPATGGSVAIVVNTRDETYPFLNVSLVARTVEELRVGLLSGMFADDDCVKYRAGRLVSANAECGTGTGGGSSFPEIAITSATYAVVTGSCGHALTFNRAAGVAVTVPAAAGFTDGCVMALKTLGAGDTVLTAAGGVSLNGVVAGSVTLPQGTAGWLWTNGSSWQTFYRRSVCTSGVLCPLDPGTGVENFTATQDAVYLVRVNAAVTGTTAYRLAKIDSSGNAVLLTTSDTGGAVGTVVSGAGTTGDATIQQVGVSLMVSQTNTSAGQYIGISSSTAGTGTSSASCPSGQVLGIWLETGVGSGTRLALLAPGICAAGASSSFLSTRYYSATFATPTGGDTTTKTGTVAVNWVAATSTGVAANPNYAVTANWTDEGGLGVTTNATTNHDGGFRQNTTSSNLQVAGLNTVPTGGAFRMRTKFVLGPDVSDMRFFARYLDGATGLGILTATDSFGLTLDTGVNANFRVQACQGGACNYSDTGIAPTANGRYEFLAETTASDTWSWYLYLNGALAASSTSVSLTTTPANGLFPNFYLVTLENVGKTFYAQRWDHQFTDR